MATNHEDRNPTYKVAGIASRAGIGGLAAVHPGSACRDARGTAQKSGQKEDTTEKEKRKRREMRPPSARPWNGRID